jgi:hypothetical protein
MLIKKLTNFFIKNRKCNNNNFPKLKLNSHEVNQPSRSKKLNNKLLFKMPLFIKELYTLEGEIIQN